MSDNFLRSRIRSKPIASIAVSGRFAGDDLDNALLQRLAPFGPDRILAKPFQLKVLLGAVEELVG